MSPPPSKPPNFQFRLYTLPNILLLSTITLILSILYINSLGPLIPSSSSSSPGIFSNTTSTPDSTNRTSHSARDSGSAVTADMSPAYGSNNETIAQLRDSNDMGALIYYASAVPLVAMLHSIVELALHITSASRPDMPADVARAGGLLSAFFSSALTSAWIVNNAFWVSCEIRHGRKCPSQVLDYRAGGDTSFSSARIVLGWMIAVFYLVHMVLVVVNEHKARRMAKLGSRLEFGEDVKREAKKEETGVGRDNNKTGWKGAWRGLGFFKS